MRVRGAIGAAAAVLAAMVGILPPATGTPGGAVGTAAAMWTPSLATVSTDGTVEQVRQLVQCGDTMYAVGRFTQIKQGGLTYQRRNAFSFSATTGHLTSWNPAPDGQVNSIALNPDCLTAYLGGSFGTVAGTKAANIAAVTTSSGTVRTGFARQANAAVNTLVRTQNGHLLVGGKFTSIGGGSHRYFASLDLATGADDGYANLRLTGTYVFTDAAGRASAHNSTHVFNLALNRAGTKLLAMGVFTSVAGQSRRQIFMSDLGPKAITVDPWHSPEFDSNCGFRIPFWLRDAAWSPDGSTVYTAATGYKPATGPGSRTTDPRHRLCDSAAAFPSTPTAVNHRWVNYTGCDSLYAAAADSSAVYFGGHERFASNPNGCDRAGPGAVPAPGVVGLDPRIGSVTVNPTRDRGIGADDLLVTDAGLWIASDNSHQANRCGRTSHGAPAADHAGICFLPY